MRPYSRIAPAIVLTIGSLFAGIGSFRGRLEGEATMSRFARIVLAVVLCGLMTLVSHSHAHALTLTPPPPPGATCQTTGSGIFCLGDFTFSGTNEDTGINCGAFEVLVTFTGTTTYELHYNSAGLGLKGIFHVNSPGTLINSVTGKTITANSHYTQTVDTATPGDLSTATRTFTGTVNISTGQSFGLVTHDVGKAVFDPSGNILFEGGPHDSLDNFPGFVQAICTALS